VGNPQQSHLFFPGSIAGVGAGSSDHSAQIGEKVYIPLVFAIIWKYCKRHLIAFFESEKFEFLAGAVRL